MRNNPRELLLHLHRRHVKAWEQKDVALLRELYAANAVIFNILPPARFNDFKTFQNTLKQYFAEMRDLSLLTSNIRIEIEGVVAWISSQYMMAYQINGRLVRQNGRWTEIYRRDGEEWRLAHVHSSPDPVQ